MLNYNLTGDALIHCLRVCEAKVLIVDEEEGCRGRIEETRARIEGELNMDITLLDAAKRGEIAAMPDQEPHRSWRDGMKGDFPLVLIYTR